MSPDFIHYQLLRLGLGDDLPHVIRVSVKHQKDALVAGGNAPWTALGHLTLGAFTLRRRSACLGHPLPRIHQHTEPYDGYGNSAKKRPSWTACVRSWRNSSASGPR
jgi:hypothetical protein